MSRPHRRGAATTHRVVAVLAAVTALSLVACSSSETAEPAPPSQVTVSAVPTSVPPLSPSATPTTARPTPSPTAPAGTPGTRVSVKPQSSTPSRPPSTPSTRTTTKAPASKAPSGWSGDWHHDIVSTTFWVGEIFDPNASDGSQMLSTYDSSWYANYGGCDGVVVNGGCETERRTAANGYFPTSMTPRQNPFYLDLPYDDLNNPEAFAQRCAVIPWANASGYKGRCTDRTFSYMKNRWVELRGPNGATCYGQVQDAGPAIYNDAAYVFGTSKPASQEFNNAGMDVSPALNGCLGFAHVNGNADRVSWRWVDASMVPDGPWTKIVTTSPPG